MKKISCLGAVLATFGIANANASYDDAKFIADSVKSR